MKSAEFKLLQIVTDHDTSAGNIVTDMFPEIRITYCGNHTAKTFHQNLLEIKAIQCKDSKPTIGKYSDKSVFNHDNEACSFFCFPT